MNIYGMVRARNEARWIRRCVESMKPVCSQVFVMDDNSADVTGALAASAGAVVLQSPFDYDDFNETRDKNWFLGHVLEKQSTFGRADWVLMIDGDEALAPGAQADITFSTESLIRWNAYRFRIVYLWDREDQKRTDRWYSTFTRPSLWRVAPGQRFESPYTTGLHCGNTPVGCACAPTPIADILHYGYMDRADRLRKYEYYNKLDPGNVFEDEYKHMVIGDLPELPATTRTKWAGPLQLEPL